MKSRRLVAVALLAFFASAPFGCVRHEAASSVDAAFADAHDGLIADAGAPAPDAAAASTPVLGSPYGALDAAIVFENGDAKPADVASLAAILRTTFGIEDVITLPSSTTRTELFERTHAVAQRMKSGGRLWLGYVGSVEAGERNVPRLSASDGAIELNDWLTAGAHPNGDTVLLLDAKPKRPESPLYFELLTFDATDVAVLAALHYPGTPRVSLAEALEKTKQGGPKIDANGDGSISGLEAMRYIRFIGEPELHIQFASRGAALSDRSPLFGPRAPQSGD